MRRPYLYRAKKPDGAYYPEWRIRYWDENGKPKTEKAYTDKSSSKRRMDQIRREVEERAHNQAIGRPNLKVAAASKLLKDYLEWGCEQGGKGGHPWSAEYAKAAGVNLEWWAKVLPINSLSDIQLAPVEQALRERRKATGVSGTRINGIFDHLRAFCNWCVARRYLAENPLRGFRKLAKSPVKTARRPLTVDEYRRLLRTVDRDRAWVYRLAVETGLRYSELKALRVHHFAGDALTLPAESTKNRMGAIISLDPGTAAALREYVGSRAATAPILPGIVASNPARALDIDLRDAGISKLTKQGRLDFHALRVTLGSLLAEVEADLKTRMAIMRHSDPRLTVGPYDPAMATRVSQARLKLTEQLRAE